MIRRSRNAEERSVRQTSRPSAISGQRYGVLIACREVPNSITQENVLMLELVTAQLAAAISKENIG